MYLAKNSFRNTVRNRGKNILIGIIITVVTICTCIALSINKAGNNLVNTYKKTNPLEVSFSLNMGNLRQSSDDEKTNFQSITVDDVKNYADSDLVKDYYYTLESSVSSTNISAVSDNERPNADGESEDKGFGDKHGSMNMGSVGDFRITAYSNFAYLSDFESGTKKITEGSMISGYDSTDEVVISSSLADENELSIGDTITICLPDDESVTFEFKIVGIYSDSSDDSANNFMSMNALNSANQIYANISSVQKILDAVGEDDTKLVQSNGLSAKFYLTDNDKLEEFEEEIREKGLSEYYLVNTNEEEVLASLKPIQNISTFSRNFLIVIVIIAVVVLTVINFLNIRDRKYEIGVLRAIGMSKSKVTIQLVLETFFVAMASLVLGTGIGVILNQPVTNKILESEISSYEEKTENIAQNFGRDDFGKPSENISKDNMPNDNSSRDKDFKQSNVDYVDTLKVEIDFTTILQLFGISILLTICSSIAASMFINKYNPNRILQDR